MICSGPHSPLEQHLSGFELRWADLRSCQLNTGPEKVSSTPSLRCIGPGEAQMEHSWRVGA